MFKKRVKMFFVGALTALFLFSVVGCSTLGIGVERNETTDFVIKQVSRSLGYKVSDRNPNSICKVKEISEIFLTEVSKEDYSEDGANVFADQALNYLADQIHVEDEILAMSLKDLIHLVKIDLDQVKVDDENVELVKLAVKSYLEGLDVVVEQRSIVCD